MSNSDDQDDTKSNSLLLDVINRGFTEVRTDLHEIRADVRVIQSTQVEHGKELGGIGQRVNGIEHRCLERGQKCSAEFRRLGKDVKDVEDLTGPIIVADRTAKAVRTAIWKKALAVTGLAVALASTFKLGTCTSGSSGVSNDRATPTHYLKK